VAAVATVGYLAFIVGPIVVGFTADTLGLPIAFIGIAALMLMLTTRRQPAFSNAP
jgi:hypothetical protein